MLQRRPALGPAALPLSSDVVRALFTATDADDNVDDVGLVAFVLTKR